MHTPAVEIADLRRIVNRLLDHIEGSGRRSITLNQTFYWDVPEEERYGIDDQPGGDILIENKNRVGGQEGLRQHESTICAVIQCTFHPLGRRGVRST